MVEGVLFKGWFTQDKAPINLAREIPKALIYVATLLYSQPFCPLEFEYIVTIQFEYIAHLTWLHDLSLHAL